VKTILRVLAAASVVWVLYLLKANVWFRLYPAVMVSVALIAFAVSLFRVPLVERFARGMGEALDDRGQRYCRRVTEIWVGFLSVHLVITIASVFASHELWALYNGVVAYLLMGMLFLGEWAYRKFCLQRGEESARHG